MTVSTPPNAIVYASGYVPITKLEIKKHLLTPTPVGVKRCFLYDDISQKNLLFYAFGYALQYIVKYLRSVCLADEVALKL